MKILFSLFLICVSATMLFAVEFPLRACSIHQRGVLDAGGIQRPVDVFVKRGDTIRVMLVCEFGTMAKLEISENGEVLSLKNGAFMSKFDAENFFLADVMMSMGFFAHFSPELIHLATDAMGRASCAVSLKDGSMITFSNYKKNANLDIPFDVKISRKNYTLTLKTVRIF